MQESKRLKDHPIMCSQKTLPPIDFDLLHKDNVAVPKEVKSLISDDFVSIESNQKIREALTKGFQKSILNRILNSIGDSFNIYSCYLALLREQDGHVYIYCDFDVNVNKQYRDFGFTFNGNVGAWGISPANIDEAKLGEIKDFLAVEYMVIICLNSGQIFDSEEILNKEGAQLEEIVLGEEYTPDCLPNMVEITKEIFATAYNNHSPKNNFEIQTRGLSIYDPHSNEFRVVKNKSVIKTNLKVLMFRMSRGSYYCLFQYDVQNNEIAGVIFKTKNHAALEDYRILTRNLKAESFEYVEQYESF